MKSLLTKKINIKENDSLEISSNYNKKKSINHITKKKWGYYLTDSSNHTLKKNGFKTAIVVSQLTKKNKIFVNIVHEKRIAEFQKYLVENKSFVLSWLDQWSK